MARRLVLKMATIEDESPVNNMSFFFSLSMISRQMKTRERRTLMISIYNGKERSRRTQEPGNGIGNFDLDAHGRFDGRNKKNEGKRPISSVRTLLKCCASIIIETGRVVDRTKARKAI